MGAIADQLLKDLKIKREAWVMEHYGKHEVELSLDEMKELDNELPVWQLTFTKYADPIEISLGGTRVRNYGEEQEYKIFYILRRGKHYYPFFNVKAKGRRYPQSVHQMVAKANIENPENKPEVNHIDGDKWNNDYLNLEWVTHKENQEHASRTGLMASGEDVGTAKHTREQAIKVCEMLQHHPDWPYRKIAEIAGTSITFVSHIYRKELWDSVTKNYTFPPRETRGFPEDKIIDACELLQDNPDLTYEEIEEITGVPVSTISRIYGGKRRAEISAMFDFPDRQTRGRNTGEINGMSKYTTEQAKQVCEMLNDVYLGKSKLYRKDIAEKLGVTKNFVDKIGNGQRWREVSKNYEFSKSFKK